jgi:hypothetical protein
MLALKLDYEITKQRFNAFWDRELLDRPLVQFTLFKPRSEQQALPFPRHGIKSETMLDADFQAEWQLANLSNQLFLGDTLPIACPNLGPAVTAAFYGCPLYFMDDGTSWNGSVSAIADRRECLIFDWESPWLKSLHELTDAFLDIGEGRFITGISDWLLSGDCLAAILGPERLAVALKDDPDWVRQNLDLAQADFERLYLEFQTKLCEAGQPMTTWVPLLSESSYYVVANDFSTMVSTEMYRDIFLRSVIRQCQFLGHTVYHLDGPGALRHLDTILEVDALDGVSFIPPPGDVSFKRWANVYRRIQDANKCLLVNCDLNEIAEIPHILKPEGLLLNVQNVSSVDEVQTLFRFLEKWPEYN